MQCAPLHFGENYGDDDDASEDEMEPLAEVYSLRGTRQLMPGGGRTGSASGVETKLAEPRDALNALDGALRHEMYRAPRHRWGCATVSP
jgi:hypothetical protein